MRCETDRSPRPAAAPMSRPRARLPAPSRALAAAGAAPFDWVLFERADYFGGKVRTERVDGFVIEGGPDSFIVEKPWPMELARKLGIADRLLDSNEDVRRSYVFSRGRPARAARGSDPDGADAARAVRAVEPHQPARQAAHGPRPRAAARPRGRRREPGRLRAPPARAPRPSPRWPSPSWPASTPATPSR